MVMANLNGTDSRAGVNDGIDIVRDVELFRFADQTATIDAFRAAHEGSQRNTISGTIGNDVPLGTRGNDSI